VNEAIFILNGVNITADTEGIETLRERIYYDEDLRGYLREIGGELTLNGDAFRFVQDRFKFDFDNPIPCSLSVFNPHTEIIESVFNGVIFPADCEFDLYAKKVTCQLVDTTFFAKIDNNKNLKFTINAGLSKLGVDISGRGGEIDYQMVSRMWADASSGQQPVSIVPFPGFPESGRFTKAITLFQALDYLVAAMTDGDVAFFSTFLTDSATDPNYVIMSGEQVRMADPLIARRPMLSWAELFGDLSRQFNLLMAVEEFEPNRFRIRVEPYEFWKQQQVTDLFEVKPRVKERVDIAMLPSSVLVGSAKVEKKLPIPSADMVNKSPSFNIFYVPTNTTFFYDFIPETPFIYHWQEEYNYQYQSNVDSPQVLRHSVLITDTKLYQYQVSQFYARVQIGGFDTEQDVDTSYDEDVFLIHSTAEFTLLALTLRRPVIYQEPFFYIINRDINNVNTLFNNTSSIPANAFMLYSAVSGQSFKALYDNTTVQPARVLLDQNGSNLRTLYQVLGTLGAGGEWIGNTTYFGASGLASIIGDLGAPNASAVPPSTNLRVVAGFNDITAPGFDNSGNYNTTAYSWTVTFTALYSFQLFLEWASEKPFTFILAQWDSLGNLKRANRFGNTVFAGVVWVGSGGANQNTYSTFAASTPAYTADAGDVFQLICEVATRAFNPLETPDNNLYLSENSFWQISGSSLPDAGGVVFSKEKGTTLFIENELEADIPLNIWNQIKANPFAKFLYQVADDGEARVGYLKDFDREIISGRFNGVTKPERPVPVENQTLQTDPIEEEIPEPDEPE
jgi:hypothetical protein